MTPIQIILVAVFVLAAWRVFNRFQHQELTRLAMVGWLLFWVVAAVIVLLPNSTFYFARLVGVTRGADLVVYVALVVLFFIAFRGMVRQEKLQRDITKLTRAAALYDKDRQV